MRTGWMRPGLRGCLVLGAIAVAGWGAAVELPTEDGRTVVAYVNDEAVYLDEVLETLAGGMGGVEGAAHGDPAEALQRLVNARLIVQEAQAIGLDDLPEFATRIENSHLVLMRNLLFAGVLSAVTEPDEALVKDRYQSAMEQARLRALFLPNDDDAAAFRRGLEKGDSFDDLADEFVKDGRASEGETGTFASLRDLHPDVRTSLESLEPGQSTGVIRVPGGWAAAKLLARRVPDDPERREEIRQAVLTTERQQAVRKHADDLKRKLTTIDTELLDGLDFGPDGPGAETYVDDDRILARVEGGDDVTVAEFAGELQRKFFHGAARAAERGTLGSRSRAVLEEILDKRVVKIEAERLGIPESADYHRSMRDIRDGLLFALFLDRVVEPEIEVTDSDLESYIASHREEFRVPAMLRLDGLTLDGRVAAEQVLEKLRGGTDLAWLKANTSGQVPSADDDTLASVRGRLVMLPGLPDPLRQELAGSKAGEFRLAEGANGVFHVIAIEDLVPERMRAPDEIRGEIEPKVLARKRQEAVERYAARLAEASEIRILAGGPALREAILAEVQSGG